MERRLENRFNPNQAVTLRVQAIRPGPILQASVLDISGSGMRLRSPLPVPCGAPVEIEAPEILSRGTVIRCEPELDETYTVGLQLSDTMASCDTYLARLAASNRL